MDDTLRELLLEESGAGGYAMCRIPGMAVTAAGTILCYYEARRSKDDWAQIDILLRRSTDGGKTFSGRRILASSGRGHTAHNPIFIVQGTVLHFLWNLDYERGFHQVSLDDGVTFSEPREITCDMAEFRREFPWNVAAFGPGHGVCVSGRLAVPVWFANGRVRQDGRTREHHPSICAVFYSDDAGTSWKVSPPFPTGAKLRDPNETSAALLPNGEGVLYSIRHEGSQHLRALCRSSDGVDFEGVKLCCQLRDPVCFGSLTSGETPFGFRIYSCNCDNGDVTLKPNRIHLRLKRSGDSGATWSDGLMLAQLGGYSDLALSQDGKWVYCLFERLRRDEEYELDLLFAACSTSLLEDEPEPLG